jgi:hypothetical protein
MIEDDEGFLQWNAQQAMENNYPEENNEYGYIDDYYCIYCGKWLERPRKQWHEPNCLHNPMIQRDKAFRNDEWMIAVGVNRIRPRDVTRRDRWIYTYLLGKQQSLSKIKHHTGKSIILPCTPHHDQHGYDTLQEWFMTNEYIESQGGRRIGGWKWVYPYNTRDTITNIVSMGPAIKEWDRDLDLEIEEKRNLPDWSQKRTNNSTG